ncbi:hypothetical protein Trydic_g7300 [Trypoxylus dichotomus]
MDLTYPEYNGEHFHYAQLFPNIQTENVDAVCIYTDGSKCSGGCGYGVDALKLEYRRIIRIHNEAETIKYALTYVTKKGLRRFVIIKWKTSHGDLHDYIRHTQSA